MAAAGPGTFIDPLLGEQNRCGWRDDPKVQRVLVVATDAPFHTPDGIHVNDRTSTVAALNAEDIILIGLKAGIAGIELDDLAAATGGSVQPLSADGSNIGAKGVLPVAILGTQDLDVSTIDPATLMLEGVAPLRWTWSDVATPFEPWTGESDCWMDCTEEGPDGYMDLTLKLKTQEVVAAVGDVADGECGVLMLEGNFFDGRAIAGEDVVVFLAK